MYLMFIGRYRWIKHSETKWWTRSTDKISEVISQFESIQSNSVTLEGSCQSMVYRSVFGMYSSKTNETKYLCMDKIYQHFHMDFFN